MKRDLLAMISHEFSVSINNSNVFNDAFELQCDIDCGLSQPLAMNTSESTQQPSQLEIGFTRKGIGLLKFYVLGCDQHCVATVAAVATEATEATIAKTVRMKNKNEYELHCDSSITRAAQATQIAFSFNGIHMALAVNDIFDCMFDINIDKDHSDQLARATFNFDGTDM